MPPLKDCRTHSIVISKFFQRGFFYSNPSFTVPSFTVPRVRYIINTYSIVNVIKIKEALWHSTLRNAYKRSST